MTAEDRRGNIGWWCALAALCCVLLAPLMLADVPPLLDYPNHLARLFLLAFLRDDPVLARFYEEHWAIIPNLGLDLTVPPLLRILPVHILGRTVIGVALLLPVFGVIAFQRALGGQRSYWPLGAGLFAYNAALLQGFLNFTLSVGLALLAAAAWIAWRERRPIAAIVIAMAGAVALFFCHLTGLLLFAILIGAHEVATLRATPISVRWLVGRATAVMMVFALPVFLYALSDLRQMQGGAEFRSIAGKAHAAMTPVINYLWPLDLLTAGLCLTVPVYCLARRWCVVSFEAGLALAIVVALFIGLPNAFKGTFDLDTRFIVMAAFLLPASLITGQPPRRAVRAIGIGFALLFVARMTVVSEVWGQQAANLAGLRSAIASIRPGDVVLTMRGPRQSESWESARNLSDGTVTDAHLPALLMIEHRAWWPYLFDNRSQQPIETREPYRALAARIDTTRDPIGLLTLDAPETRVITHVLVLGTPPTPDEIAKAGFHRVAGNDEATLFARDGISQSGISQSRPPSPPSDH